VELRPGRDGSRSRQVGTVVADPSIKSKSSVRGTPGRALDCSVTPDGRVAGRPIESRGPEVWAGLEASFLDVGSTSWDQLRLTGHDGRDEDIEVIRRLGARAVRYPVLWGRSGSTRGSTDWTFAEARVRALHDANVKPILGLLHHGYGPRGTDPLDPDWPVSFARYAARAARRLPAWAFLPINEPLTTARFGGLYGWWPPYGRDDGIFADLLLAQVQATRLASREIRRLQPTALIIVNEDCGRTEGDASLQPVVDHYERRRWLAFDLLTGRVDRSHPMWSALGGNARRRRILDELRAEPEVPDALGVDYYITSDRYLAPPEADSDAAFRDVELVRVHGGDVGFDRPIREAWDRYRLPLALTEVQLAGPLIDQVAWWAEAWSSAAQAVDAGVPVLGVTSWATFGAMDWSSLLGEERGDYVPGCIDVRPTGCHLTPLGRAVARTARRGKPPAPADGWWRRQERVTFERDI
jgi:dTDP-4-dehydrorhamnose reductase